MFNLKKIQRIFFLSMGLLSASLLLRIQFGQAAINNYCTKAVASCAGAGLMTVPIADGSVNPLTINYGCSGEYNYYLGCAPGDIPCCSKTPTAPLTPGPSSLAKACQTATPNLQASSCTTQQECDAQVTAWKSAIGPGSTTEWSDNFLPDPACPSPTPGEVGCCMFMGKEVAPTAPGATTPKPPTEYKLANPLGTTSIPVILGRIISTFLGIVGAIALAVFVYGGVMWMTARGDQGQVKKGQDALKSAVIGLFIIMFSYALTGNFIKFWTAEERDIAAQEGRPIDEEDPTQAGDDLDTIRSAAEGEQGEVTAGQDAAEEAGVEAGVAPTPASQCDNPMMTPAQKQECLEGSVGTGWLEGQSEGGASEPSGFGQPNACQPGDPDCSNVGWRTVCNQTIFDTGYGTYNDLQCLSYADCDPNTVVSSECSELSGLLNVALGTQSVNYGCETIPGVSGFGLNCGSGGACCKKK